MKNIHSVASVAVAKHLEEQKSAISLAGDPNSWTCHRALLEADDIQRVVLWQEFHADTRGGSCRLPDAMTESEGKERFKDLLGRLGRAQLVLRESVKMEPTAVSDRVDGLLYFIDGNHRLIANQLAGRDLEGVFIYLAVRDDAFDSYSTPPWLRSHRANTP